VASPAENKHGFAVISINSTLGYETRFLSSSPLGLKISTEPIKPSRTNKHYHKTGGDNDISKGCLSPSSLGLVKLSTVKTGVKANPARALARHGRDNDNRTNNLLSLLFSAGFECVYRTYKPSTTKSTAAFRL
jgi:hypothetical protein